MQRLFNEPAIQRLFKDISIQQQQNRVKAARQNPSKYWLSTLIADNKPASYRYMVIKRTQSSEHRWCRSCHKNIAGFYLIWYEIENKRKIKRTCFTAEKTKKAADAYIDKKCSVDNVK